MSKFVPQTLISHMHYDLKGIVMSHVISILRGKKYMTNPLTANNSTLD